jgi:acetyltransferase-like isoleucine patch superfamily enzyme
MLRPLIDTAGKLRDLWHIRRDPVGYARSIGVKVGEGCRLIDVTRRTFGTEPYLIRLGDRVTLTAEIRFVTHDGGVWVFRPRDPEIELFGPVVVGSDVFVGMRTMIMPGVTIGDRCIIGAGSVVARSIPPNSVAAGVPARVIRTVDEYFERLKGRATHFRSMPLDEKRKRLEAMFLHPAAATDPAEPAPRPAGPRGD